MARGHAASFINQVYIILVNSFEILACITNGASFEAWACAFLCFRARDNIVCSSGLHSLPFLALATSRVSLSSGLSILHMCCHVLCPAHVFLSSLGNTPVTEIRGSPFPHGGVILNMGWGSCSSVIGNPTACVGTSIAGIGSSPSNKVPALSGKNLPYWTDGGNASLFFLFWLDLLEVWFGIREIIQVSLIDWCSCVLWKQDNELLLEAHKL